MPASFRSYLNSMGYSGVICYPSFNNPSIEACPQNRIEKLSESIDLLNPLIKYDVTPIPIITKDKKGVYLEKEIKFILDLRNKYFIKCLIFYYNLNR